MTLGILMTKKIPTKEKEPKQKEQTPTVSLSEYNELSKETNILAQEVTKLRSTVEKLLATKKELQTEVDGLKQDNSYLKGKSEAWEKALSLYNHVDNTTPSIPYSHVSSPHFTTTQASSSNGNVVKKEKEELLFDPDEEPLTAETFKEKFPLLFSNLTEYPK